MLSQAWSWKWFGPEASSKDGPSPRTVRPCLSLFLTMAAQAACWHFASSISEYHTGLEGNRVQTPEKRREYGFQWS